MQVKEVPLQEKISTQNFDSDAKTPYKPITKAGFDTSNDFLEEGDSTARAVEEKIEPNTHSKSLGLMNKIGAFDTSLVGNLVNLKAGEKNCFRLYVDPHIHPWSEIPMHVSKIYGTYAVGLFFRNRVKIFTLKDAFSDLLPDCVFNVTNESITNFLHERNFDSRLLVKKMIQTNISKNIF